MEIKMNIQGLRSTTMSQNRKVLSSLASARSSLTKINMPEKYSYSSTLRKIPDKILQIENDVKELNKYIEKKCGEFEKISTAASKLAGNLGNVLSGLSKGLRGAINNATGTFMVGMSTILDIVAPNANSNIATQIKQMSQNFLKDLSNTNAKTFDTANLGNEILDKALKMDLSDTDQKASENRQKYWEFARAINWDNAKEKEEKANILKAYGDLEIKPWDIKEISKNSDGTWSITLHDGTNVSYNYSYNSNTNKTEGYIIIDYGDGIKLNISLNEDTYKKKTIFKDGKEYGYPFGHEDGGGNQTSFRIDNIFLCQDEKMQETIRRYWPEATDEDIEMLFYKIERNGCGYTACANTIFKEYEGKEIEFEKKFGFPMYIENSKGERNYNYEYLIADYYAYVWSSMGYDVKELYEGMNKNIAGDGSLIDDVSDTSMATGARAGIYKQFENFMKDRYEIDIKIQQTDTEFGGMYMGDLVNANFETQATKNNFVEVYKNLKTSNNHVFIKTTGWDLYSMDGKLQTKNGGGHAMYVLGVSKDGKRLKVSSWGKEYWLDLSRQDEMNSWIDFTTIEFK